MSQKKIFFHVSKNILYCLKKDILSCLFKDFLIDPALRPYFCPMHWPLCIPIVQPLHNSIEEPALTDEIYPCLQTTVTSKRHEPNNFVGARMSLNTYWSNPAIEGFKKGGREILTQIWTKIKQNFFSSSGNPFPKTVFYELKNKEQQMFFKRDSTKTNGWNIEQLLWKGCDNVFGCF